MGEDHARPCAVTYAVEPPRLSATRANSQSVSSQQIAKWCGAPTSGVERVPSPDQPWSAPTGERKLAVARLLRKRTKRDPGGRGCPYALRPRGVIQEQEGAGRNPPRRCRAEPRSQLWGAVEAGEGRMCTARPSLFCAHQEDDSLRSSESLPL